MSCTRFGHYDALRHSKVGKRKVFLSTEPLAFLASFTSWEGMVFPSRESWVDRNLGDSRFLMTTSLQQRLFDRKLWGKWLEGVEQHAQVMSGKIQWILLAFNLLRLSMLKGKHYIDERALSDVTGYEWLSFQLLNVLSSHAAGNWKGYLFIREDFYLNV